jgi:hypothetical protein
MKVSNNELFNGFTDIHKLTAADITAIGTGEQRTIALLPPGGVVTACGVFEAVDFAGTSSDLTLDVGTTAGDPDEFINALDLDGLTKAAFNTGDVLINTAAGYVINDTADAVPILIEPNFTGTVTGGEWYIGLKILDLGLLASNA